MFHAHTSVVGKSGKLVKSRCCRGSGHRLLACVRCGHSSEFFRRWALACAVRRRGIRILGDGDTSRKGDERLPNGKTRKDAFLGHDVGFVEGLLDDRGVDGVEFVENDWRRA